MKLPGVGFSSTLTLISVSRSSITHSLRVDRQELLRQVDAQDRTKTLVLDDGGLVDLLPLVEGAVGQVDAPDLAVPRSCPIDSTRRLNNGATSEFGTKRTSPWDSVAKVFLHH
jgi:hypothetical protein